MSHNPKYSRIANELAFELLKDQRIQSMILLQMDMSNFAKAIAIGIEKGVEMEREHQKQQAENAGESVPDEEEPQTRFALLDVSRLGG